MNETSTTHDVVIVRDFDAPREQVFKAWSTPEILEQWHAPHGCSIEFPDFEFRAGGFFHSLLTTPTGYGCRCKGTYLEIDEPSKIVYLMGFVDEDGNPAPPPAGMDPEWPVETTITITFEDLGGRTRLTLHQNVDATLAQRTGALPSWIEMLERMEEEVGNRQRQ